MNEEKADVNDDQGGEQDQQFAHGAKLVAIFGFG
jgi:hypothetical protein